MQVQTAMLLYGLAIKIGPGNYNDRLLLMQQVALPEVETFQVPWKAVWEMLQEVEGP